MRASWAMTNRAAIAAAAERIAGYVNRLLTMPRPERGVIAASGGNADPARLSTEAT